MIFRLFSIAVAVLLAWCQAVLAAQEGRVHEIPLFIADGDPDGRQGFMRVTNHSDEAGVVQIHGVDDAGRQYGPVTLSLDAGETQPLNSGDIESGNEGKGLSAGLGDGDGEWRLLLYSTLDIEPLNYIRTSDGFLTAMNAVVNEVSVGHRVAIFNPGSNDKQVSWLRLINPGDAAASVTIVAQDEPGMAAPGGEVSLTLAPGQARRITAQELEMGTSDLTGSLGDGRGKWSFWVSSDQPIRVMSLMSTPTGHISNLSGTNPTYLGAAGMWQVSFDDDESAAGFIILLPDSRLYAWLPEAGGVTHIARGVHNADSNTITASGEVYESGKIEQDGLNVTGGGEPVEFTATYRGGDWIRGTYAVAGGSPRGFGGWAFSGFQRGGAVGSIAGTWSPVAEDSDLPVDFSPNASGAFEGELNIESEAAPGGEISCDFTGGLGAVNRAFNLYVSEPEINCGFIVFAEGQVEMVVAPLDAAQAPGMGDRALVLVMIPDDNLAEENRRKIGLGGTFMLTR